MRTDVFHNTWLRGWLVLTVPLVALVVLCAPARAATSTWNKASGGPYNWSDTTNWNEGVAPNAADAIADFNHVDLTSDLTIHLDGAFTVNQMIFGDTTTSSAGGWLIDNGGNNANSLTLGGATASITVNALGAGKNVEISAMLAGSAALTLTTGAGTGLNDGLLILSGPNTYLGTTAIGFNSRVNIRNNSALGDPAGGAVSVGYGGQLQMQGNITVGAKALSLTYEGPVQGEGNNHKGALRNISDNNTWQGAVTLVASGNPAAIICDAGSLTFDTSATFSSSNVDLRVSGAGNTIINGAIALGSGRVLKNFFTLAQPMAQTGTLTLGGANTYTGVTTVSGGTLFVNNASGSATGSGAVGITAVAGPPNSDSDPTLAGNGAGRITGAITVGVPAAGKIPTVNPGGVGAAGTLNTTDVLFKSASKFVVDLFSPATSDQLNSAGTVDLNNDAGTGSVLSVNVLPGATITTGDTFTIISATTVANTFYGLADGAALTATNVPSYHFTIHYNTGSNPQTVTLVAAATPAGTTTAVVLAGGSSPSTYGDTVTFTATVTPAAGGPPTGTITFSIDGVATAPVAVAASGNNATASLSLNTLKVGGSPHSISATYNGDSTFGPSLGTVAGGQSVNPKALTVTGLSASSKPYDGNTTTTLTGTAALNGKVGADDVSLTGTPSGAFADPNPGFGKTVIISGLSLTGADVGNYTLPQPTTTANIIGTTFTWTDSSGDNLWSNAANWSPAGGPPDNGNNVIIGQAGAGNPVLDMNATIGTLELNQPNDLTDIGGSATAFKLSISGGITVDPTATHAYTITMPLHLAASQTWTVGTATNNTDASLTITSVIDGPAGANLTTAANAGVTISYNGGKLTLTGANTYLGTTTVGTNSRLNIGNSTALGLGTDTVTVNYGGQLQLQGSVTVAKPLSLIYEGPIHGEGNDHKGALRSVDGTNTWQGTVTLLDAGTGHADIDCDSGTLTFNTAATSFTSSNVSLRVMGAGDTTITGVIALGTGALLKDIYAFPAQPQPQTGALTLAGANTYSGGTVLSSNGTNLSAGTLVLAANSTPTSGTVTSGPLGIGTLTLSGFTPGGNDNHSPAGATIRAAGAARTVGNALNFGGSVNVGPGFDLTFNGPVTLTVTPTVIMNDPTFQVTVVFGGVISGAHGFSVRGLFDTANTSLISAGKARFSGDNTFNGTFGMGAYVADPPIDQSNLVIQVGTDSKTGPASGPLGVGPVDVNGGALEAIGGARSVGNNIDGLNGSLFIVGTNDLTWTGFIKADNSSLLNRDISVAAGLTFTATNALEQGGNGNYSYTKKGLGNWRITYLNNQPWTYQGTTYVTEGTLTVDGSISSSSGVALGNGAMLRGIGSVPGVTADGTLFPGNTDIANNFATKGTLTVGSLTLTATGKLEVRGSNTANTAPVLTDSVLVLAGGAVTIDPAAILELDLIVISGTNISTSPPAILDAASGTPISTSFAHVLVPNHNSPVNLKVGYADATATIIETQNAPTNSAITLGGARKTVYLTSNGAVTPVTIDRFAARPEGRGVLLSWHATSEYQNLGFNVYRKADGATNWTKVNGALVPGRITNSAATTYHLYDWGAADSYEYKLESVSLQNEKETYSELVSVDSRGWLPDDLSAEGFAAAIASVPRADQPLAARADSATDTVQGRDAATGLPWKGNTAIARGGSPWWDGLETPKPCKGDRGDLAASMDISNALSGLLADESALSRGSRPWLWSQRPFGAMSARACPLAASRWFRPRPSSAGGVGAVKVVYSAPGVYKVAQSSLPAGFDVSSVSIKRGGRAVPALAVLSDGLLLYGPGYADDYTDKDAIFLTASAQPTVTGVPRAALPLAARADSQDLFTQPASTTAGATVTVQYHDVYYDWTLRPYNYPPWFSDQYLTEGSTQNFAINVPNVAAAPATLVVNLWSVTGVDTVKPDHALQIAVNGQAVGQTKWDGGGKFLNLMFRVPANVLTSGTNTITLVTPNLDGVSSQIALLHSIAVKYTKALAGSSGVEVDVSGKPRVFEVSGLNSGSLWVVDARMPDRAALVPYEAQAQNDGTFKARFVAQPGGTGTYLVVAQGSEMVPLSVTQRTLKPVSPGVQYLAVGPTQFSAAVQPLLNARQSDGLKTSFVEQEAIFDYYGFGRYGPAPIRAAVRALRPQYLLLLGRTIYDYRNYSGANADPLCPAFLVSTSFSAQTTSDALFGDLGRGYPEVAVGRLPVNDASELATAVGRILAHANLPVSGWRAQAVADRADASAGDFAAESDSIAAALPDITWTKNYLGVTYQTSPEVTTAMTAAANGAADIIVYVGHGNATRLGKDTPPILDTNSVQSWTGNVVLLQATCTGNWVANDDSNYHSIASQAMTQTGGGISASIGTTTYMTSANAVAFMTQLLTNAESGGTHAAGAVTTWGTALMKAQQWAAKQAGAQTNWNSDLSRTECLLGDPAMPVSNNDQ